MKKLIQFILLTFLILFSGCQVNTSGPGRQDINLPTIEGVNYLADITEIGFEWQPSKSDRVIGYNIYRFNDTTKQYTKIKKIDTKYTSHFVDYDLASNKTYRYRFSTFSESGESELSKEIIITTEKIEKIPYVKTVLTLPKMIKIIWRPHPNQKIHKYLIQRKEGRGEWKLIAEVNGRLNAEYIDTSVDTGKQYQYRIAAVTFNNISSDYSDEAVGKTKDTPSSVLGLNATTELPMSVILTWELNSEKDIVHYNIYRRAPGVKGFVSQYDLIGTTKKQTFSDETLAAGEGAEYIVTAVNKFGIESEGQKEPVYGSTLGEIKTPKLVATKVTPEGIELQWNTSDMRIKSYSLVKEFENGQDLDGQIFENLQNGLFIDRDVAQGIRYSYKLIAVDKNNIKIEDSEPLNLKIPVGQKY